MDFDFRHAKKVSQNVPIPFVRLEEPWEDVTLLNQWPLAWLMHRMVGIHNPWQSRAHTRRANRYVSRSLSMTTIMRAQDIGLSHWAFGAQRIGGYILSVDKDNLSSSDTRGVRDWRDSRSETECIHEAWMLGLGKVLFFCSCSGQKNHVLIMFICQWYSHKAHPHTAGEKKI